MPPLRPDGRRLAFSLLLLVTGVFFLLLASRSNGDVPIHVYVLAGQSNMVGRGQPVTDGAASSPNVLVWRGGWQVAHDPLGTDKSAGVGPGMTFGLKLSSDRSEVVGLVMCAVGGTSIEDWKPSKVLFKQCVLQVQAAGGQVDGVLFLQGETDALSKGAAKNWLKYFRKFQRGAQENWGRVTLGQIGSIDIKRYPYQELVRNQQAAAGLPLAVSKDLTVGSDGVHFTVSSYLTLGVRFATATEGAS